MQADGQTGMTNLKVFFAILPTRLKIHDFADTVFCVVLYISPKKTFIVSPNSTNRVFFWAANMQSLF
jgi:hypothetical protein